VRSASAPRTAVAARLRHPALALVLGQLTTAVTAFVMNLLSSNVLAPEDRGFLAFFLQLAYVTTVLGLLGVERPYAASRTTATFASAYRDLTALTRTAWVCMGALVLLAGVLALRGSWPLAALALGSAVYMRANTAIRKVRIAYIASRSTGPFVSTLLGTQLALLASGTALFLLDVDSSAAWLDAYAATGLAAPLIARRWSTREPLGRDASPVDLSRVRREGLRLLPASFGNTALLKSDRLLLPFLSTPAELGRYVAVATIMEVGTWPIQQWVDASLGRWRATGARGPRRRMVMWALVGAVAVTAGLCAVTFVVIEHWLPAEYRSAQRLLLPLAVGAVLYAGTRIQQGLMIARGLPGAVSVAEVSGLGVSLLLYVVLMPRHGAMGAAVGSALGYLALLLVASVIQRRHARTHDAEGADDGTA